MTGTICQGSTHPLHQNFQAMAEAIDKPIERQNKRGYYVVDTDLTALTFAAYFQ
jgi:hypothetical protein